MPRFYTALGWLVWRIAKRQLRKKAAEKVPRRGKVLKVLVLGTLLGGAAFAGTRALRAGDTA